MRVISGKYRGRRINSPINDEIRPTGDKVKESIFNVIQFDIAGSRFIDLFAGSGGIGIEALSRDAKEVLFADNAKTSLELLKSNLKGIDDNYKVVARDYKDALYSAQGKWKFIFVDPPYRCEYIADICKIVMEKDMLERDGYIIYEHSDKEYDLPEDMCIVKRKVFGIAVVDYIGYSRGRAALTGSFDPITKGHLDILDKALEDFDKVTVLIAQNPDKQYLFSLEERVEFAKLATNEYLNVDVDVCDGYVYEYCKDKNIKTVYRGYRNDTDLEYEKDMAKFNEERGVKTVLIQGERAISSTLIRDGLKSGEDVKKYLPNNCARAVIKAYKEKL